MAPEVTEKDHSGQEELMLLLHQQLLCLGDLSESPGSSLGSPRVPLLPGAVLQAPGLSSVLCRPAGPGTPLEMCPDSTRLSQGGGSSCMWKRDNSEVMTENPSRQSVYSVFIVLRGSTGCWERPVSGKSSHVSLHVWFQDFPVLCPRARGLSRGPRRCSPTSVAASPP